MELTKTSAAQGNVSSAQSEPSGPRQEVHIEGVAGVVSTGGNSSLRRGFTLPRIASTVGLSEEKLKRAKEQVRAVTDHELFPPRVLPNGKVDTQTSPGHINTDVKV